MRARFAAVDSQIGREIDEIRLGRHLTDESLQRRPSGQALLRAAATMLAFGPLGRQTPIAAGTSTSTGSPAPTLNSTLQRSILEEFQRLCAKDRKHLVLPELLKLRFSQVPVANLAVLWVLDRCGSVGCRTVHSNWAAKDLASR